MLKNAFKTLNTIIMALIIAACVSAPVLSQGDAWRDIHKQGRDFQDAGLYDDAIRAYQKAIGLAPNEYFLYNDLGEAYILKSEFQLAADSFQKALALKPDDATVHTNLGIAYDSLGEYDMALQEHQKALEINPNHPTAHNNLGHVYEQTGRLSEAAEEYKKAIVINTNFLLAQVNLGNVLVKEGFFEQGVAAHERAVQIDPKNASAYNNLAHAYYKLGNYDKAIQNLNKALELDPGNETVRSNLDFLIAKQAELQGQPQAGQAGQTVKPATTQPPVPAAPVQASGQTPAPQVAEVPVTAMPPSSQVLESNPEAVTQIIVGPPRTETPSTPQPETATPAPVQPQAEAPASAPQAAATPYSPSAPQYQKPTQQEELYYAGVVPSNRKFRTERLLGPEKEEYEKDRQAAQGAGALSAPSAAAAPVMASSAAPVIRISPAGGGLAAPLLPVPTRFEGTTFVEVPDPLMRRRVLLIPFENAPGFSKWNPTPAELLTRKVETALRDSGQFRVKVASPSSRGVNQMQDDDLTKLAAENQVDLVVMGRIADHGIYYSEKDVNFGLKEKKITEARTVLVMRIEDAVNDKSYASESVLGSVKKPGAVSYVEEYDMLDGSIDECARELVRELAALLHIK